MRQAAPRRDHRPTTAVAAELAEWILRTGRHLPALAAFVGAFGPRLVAAGLPVWRLYLGLRRLHPAYLGRAVIWDRTTRAVVTKPRAHGIEDSAYYRDNPVSAIFERGERIRRRLDGPAEALDYPVLRALKRDGGTDYLALPLDFHGHQHQAVAFTTDRPGGFDAGHVAVLEAVLPSLAAAVEIFNDRDDARRVLATYVGARAGDRILSGAIKRGRCETLRAVLWVCDMENFTAISEALPAGDLIALLDTYLDAVVAPIERSGGEVLKFVGDAALAIFELPKDREDAATCRLACAAAREAIAAVEALNETWSARTGHRIGCGVALHIGEVSYGNVGAADRLDFTVIGPAVNLVTRLEQLTRQVGTRILLSEDFSEMLADSVAPLGSFALKGIRADQRVFGLPESD
jgi:adenylate cyclase